MIDFYFRFRPVEDEKKRLRLSRLVTVFWALVLFALTLWGEAATRADLQQSNTLGVESALHTQQQLEYNRAHPVR